MNCFNLILDIIKQNAFVEKQMDEDFKKLYHTSLIIKNNLGKLTMVDNFGDFLLEIDENKQLVKFSNNLYNKFKIYNQYPTFDCNHWNFIKIMIKKYF
jgi:hypothetical protein